MKSWNVDTFFDIRSDGIDDHPGYSNSIYTCKWCGYSFETGNTCGTGYAGYFEKQSLDIHNMAIDHIMQYHLDMCECTGDEK